MNVALNKSFLMLSRRVSMVIALWQIRPLAIELISIVSMVVMALAFSRGISHY